MKTLLEPRSFSSDLERALAVLRNRKASKDNPWLSSFDISKELQDTHGIALHWRTIHSLLKRHPQMVARRKRVKRWQYMILHDGERSLSEYQEPILLIEPSKALQATLTLHSLLGALSGRILICDPYLDCASVEHLGACPVGAHVMFLTKNVREGGKVRRLVAAARIEGRNIEVRVDSTGTLHDRYVIDDECLLILGSSLNGFGKKQCFVTKITGSMRDAVRELFYSAWSSATAWF